jgi:molybdopterin molybdotransferase
MLSIREAVDLLLPHFPPRPPEPLPLLAALGRVLCEDVVATVDLPPFDNSAMDGYALRFADASHESGHVLPVQGESRAGGPSIGKLLPGHAMRIFTGAPLPVGADTVVMQEDTSRSGDHVTLREPPRAGAHVRKRGFDVRAGTPLLASGTVLGPGELALLSAQDVPKVNVHRRPRVAVLCTGDELREVGSTPRPGSIVNSNAYALHAAILQAGGEPVLLAPARDDVGEITERVREGLEADVLLTVGGVSVGEYDLVTQALAAVSVHTAFHKVAIKPGKPLLFGTRGGVPVIGLPGNPVSALVTFEVFVRPGLLQMRGVRTPFAEPVVVELTDAYEAGGSRTELARARLRAEGGRILATLNARQGSGALTSMVGVDALVVFPRGSRRFEAGASVHAIRLADTPRSATPPIDDRSP